VGGSHGASLGLEITGVAKPKTACGHTVPSAVTEGTDETSMKAKVRLPIWRDLAHNMSEKGVHALGVIKLSEPFTAIFRKFLWSRVHTQLFSCG
jgi:hypothetical protein